MLSARRQAALAAWLLASGPASPAAGAGAASAAEFIAVRGAHRLSDADAVAAKRERRKQRRAATRELRERVSATHSFGWHCNGHTTANRSPVPAPHSAAGAGGRASRGEQQQEADEDWELFQAVVGKPRGAAERRRFAAAWKDWQAAEARAARTGGTGGGGGDSGGAKRARGGATGWGQGGWPDGSGAQDGEDGRGSANRHSEGSSWAGTGSAGTSAGQRWGHASWTWADMGQGQSPSGSSSSWQSAGDRGGSFAGWADEEAWYEAPPGRRARGRSRQSSGDSTGSGGATGCSFAGSSWEWSSSWQQFAGGGAFGWHRFSASWQRAASGGGGGGGGPGANGATLSSVRLLGLESGWLSSRCGRLLRQAYLAKAKQLHPDVHAGSGASSAAAAEARFKEVQVAYESLLALAAPAR